jgi:hypothetical protein
MYIEAQQGFAGSTDGGNLYLMGGHDGGTGTEGGTRLQGSDHRFSARDGVAWVLISSGGILNFQQYFEFDDTVASPIIQHQTHASSHGTNLTIQAQTGYSGAYDGGDLILSAGLDGGTGTDGDAYLRGLNVALQDTAGTSYLVAATGSILNKTQYYLFDDAVSSPTIIQQQQTSGAGEHLTIRAQQSQAGAYAGGTLKLYGGDKGDGSGTVGDVWVVGTGVYITDEALNDVLSTSSSQITLYKDAVFDTAHVTPIIYQADETSATAADLMVIHAQDNTYNDASSAGGNIIISAGDSTTHTSADGGHAKLRGGDGGATGSTGNVMIGAGSFPTWQSLQNGIYIEDADQVPASAPSGGAFFYSVSGSPTFLTSGDLTVELDAEGEKVWGSQTTTSSSAVAVLAYTPPTNSTTYVECGVTIREDTGDYSRTMKLAATIKRTSGGTTSIMSTVTTIHDKGDGDHIIGIAINGNDVEVQLQPNSATSTDWRWWYKYNNHT